MSVAERSLAAGDDGYFEEGVGVFEIPAADGVAGFVVGDCSLFFRVEYEGLLFETADDALDGLLEMDHGDCGGACACSFVTLVKCLYLSAIGIHTDQGSFIDAVRNVCAREAGCEC